MAGNLIAYPKHRRGYDCGCAGDLRSKITVMRGEILELKNTITMMVDQLNAFASEATAWRARWNRRQLGGQADARRRLHWKDLTDSVNSSRNLTIRCVTLRVFTAVAKGDLTTKITVDAGARF
jgi:HAMP domain-containing protein